MAKHEDLGQQLCEALHKLSIINLGVSKPQNINTILKV